MTNIFGLAKPINCKNEYQDFNTINKKIYNENKDNINKIFLNNSRFRTGKQLNENTRNIGSFFVYIIPYHIDKYNDCHVLMGKKGFEYRDNETGRIGLNNNPLQWVFIGGAGGEKINNNERESIKESIFREFKEEVGYRLKNKIQKIFKIEPKYEKSNRKIFTCLYKVSDSEFNNMQKMGKYIDGKKEITSIKWILLEDCINQLKYDNLPSAYEFYTNWKKSKITNISSLFRNKIKVNWHYHSACEFEKYIYNPYYNNSKIKKCIFNKEPELETI